MLASAECHFALNVFLILIRQSKQTRAYWHSTQELNQTKCFNPFTAKGCPIDEWNRSALDRVKSISALSAHSAVKGLRHCSYNCWSWYSSSRTLKYSLAHYWFSSNCFCFRAEANVCELSSLFHRNKSFLGEISWHLPSLCSCMFSRSLLGRYHEHLLKTRVVRSISIPCSKTNNHQKLLFSRSKILFFSRHKISLWLHQISNV